MEKEYEILRQKFNALFPQYILDNNKEVVPALEDLISILKSKECLELWQKIEKKFYEIQKARRYKKGDKNE